MKTIQLKTNINCSGCVEKVKPALNETLGESNWKVDTTDPKKVLTVVAGNVDEGDVIKAVERGGYKAEQLN